MDALLLREIARDAGYGAAHRDIRNTETVAVIGDPVRRYLSKWMLNGDTALVLSFAAGMWGWFNDADQPRTSTAVSYTHLTLPTIYSV